MVNSFVSKHLAIIAALCTAVGFFGGCNSKKETTASASEATAAEVQIPENDAEVKRDSLVISFEKTPCFGRCPVYKVKVFESGFAIYEGLNFCERMGLFQTKFSQAEINEMIESARFIHYFSLNDVYDEPGVTDLPSTYSSFRDGHSYKRIQARINIPKELKDFHENLSVRLLEKDWVPYDER